MCSFGRGVILGVAYSKYESKPFWYWYFSSKGKLVTGIFAVGGDRGGRRVQVGELESDWRIKAAEGSDNKSIGMRATSGQSHNRLPN